MPKVYGKLGVGEYGPIPSGSKGNGEMGMIPVDESVPNVSRGTGANMTRAVGVSGGVGAGGVEGRQFGSSDGVHNETVDGFMSGKTERPPEKPMYR